MQASLGTFVDLVIRIDSADELEIQSGVNAGAPYLQVSGVDMDGAQAGPLRLWDHEEGAVEAGTIYILRGLKIATERQWDGEKYASDPQGMKKMDCGNRTAIEDVSAQPEITSYFH